jgi:hypothetical protein
VQHVNRGLLSARLVDTAERLTNGGPSSWQSLATVRGRAPGAADLAPKEQCRSRLVGSRTIAALFRRRAEVHRLSGGVPATATAATSAPRRRLPSIRGRTRVDDCLTRFRPERVRPSEIARMERGEQAVHLAPINVAKDVHDGL